MKTESPNFILKLSIAIGACLLVVILVLTIQSFYRVFNKKPSPAANNGPVPATSMLTDAEEEERHFAASAAHSSSAPPVASAAFFPAATSTQADAKAGSQEIKSKEHERQEMIANMRKWAKEHGGTNKGSYIRQKYK
jgi:hypothetical protein